MGKFVQLSTQIRTERNCRGEVVVGGGFVCVSMCVYGGFPEDRRNIENMQQLKKTNKTKELSHSINSSICVGGEIPEAEGRTPLCR